MAKKKPNEEGRLAEFFQVELEQARRIMGPGNVLVGDEARSRRYGLPLPSLALQYLLNSDVLPMEQLILLSGEPKTHKSSFAFEIARWVLQAGGYARVYDTEHKYSPDLAENMFGAVLRDWNWQIRNCKTFDQVRTMLTLDLRHYREHFSAARTRGGTPALPVCLIIDSLTGRPLQTTVDAFDKKVESDNMSGPRLAKAISELLRNQTLLSVAGYVVMVRHEKESISALPTFGGKRKYALGGESPEYHGGTDLRFKITESVRGTDDGWNLVRIRCHKNAFGPDRGQMAVRFSWKWFAKEGGGKTQVPRWEWDLATADFLAEYDADNIKDICRVVRGGTKAKPLFDCKQLGLTDVTGADLGMALRQDDKLLAALQDYLHIPRWRRFETVPERPNNRTGPENQNDSG